jgi:hypothetical protein
LERRRSKSGNLARRKKTEVEVREAAKEKGEKKGNKKMRKETKREKQ